MWPSSRALRNAVSLVDVRVLDDEQVEPLEGAGGDARGQVGKAWGCGVERLDVLERD